MSEGAAAQQAAAFGHLLSYVRNHDGNMESNCERFYDYVATLGAKKKAVARTVGIGERLLMRWAHDPAARPPYRSGAERDIRYKCFEPGGTSSADGSTTSATYSADGSTSSAS